MHTSSIRYSLGAAPQPPVRGVNPPWRPSPIPDLVTMPTPRVVRKYDNYDPDSAAWQWIRGHHYGTAVSPVDPARFNPSLNVAGSIAQGTPAPRLYPQDPNWTDWEMAERGLGAAPVASIIPTIYDSLLFGFGAGVGNWAVDYLRGDYSAGHGASADGPPGMSARDLSEYGVPELSLRGLGFESATANQITLSSIQTAPMIVGAAAAHGASWATALIPVIGPIVAGITIGLSLLWSRKGPKQKVATTQIVDQVEPLLQQNLAGYLSGPRTRSSQQQALANFDAGWAFVVEHCDIPEMGDPGQRCVSERQAGGQWDWFRRYRDPIANDPEVQADPAVQTVAVRDPVTGQVSYQTTGAGAGASMTPLLIGAAVLAAVLFLGGGE